MHPQYIRAPSKNLAQHLWLLNHKKEQEGGKRERGVEKKMGKNAKASRANLWGLNVFLKSTNYKSNNRRKRGGKKEKKKREMFKRCCSSSSKPFWARCVGRELFLQRKRAQSQPLTPSPPSARSLPALSLSPTDRHTERFQMFQLRRLHAAPRARRREPPDLIWKFNTPPASSTAPAEASPQTWRQGGELEPAAARGTERGQRGERGRAGQGTAGQRHSPGTAPSAQRPAPRPARPRSPPPSQLCGGSALRLHYGMRVWAAFQGARSRWRGVRALSEAAERGCGSAEPPRARRAGSAGRREPAVSCTDGRMHRCLNRLIKLGFAKSSVETPKCSAGIPPLALITPVIWPSVIEASAERENDSFKMKCELNAVHVKPIWTLRAAMLNKRCRLLKHPSEPLQELPQPEELSHSDMHGGECLECRVLRANPWL